MLDEKAVAEVYREGREGKGADEARGIIARLCGAVRSLLDAIRTAGWAGLRSSEGHCCRLTGSQGRPPPRSAARVPGMDHVDQPRGPPTSRFRRVMASTWALWTVVTIVVLRAAGFGIEYAQTGTISELHWEVIAIWAAWIAVFFLIRRRYA